MEPSIRVAPWRTDGPPEEVATHGLRTDSTFGFRGPRRAICAVETTTCLWTIPSLPDPRDHRSLLLLVRVDVWPASASARRGPSLRAAPTASARAFRA